MNTRAASPRSPKIAPVTDAGRRMTPFRSSGPPATGPAMRSRAASPTTRLTGKSTHRQSSVTPDTITRSPAERKLATHPRIVVGEVRYVCTLFHHAEELRRIHYYAVLVWEGAITNHEAESLLWLPLNDLERLDFDIDRIAVAALGRSTDGAAH